MKKINITIAVIDAVLAAVMGAVLIYSFGIMKEVSFQTAADSWAGAGSEVPYTAVSAYTSPDNAFDLQGVYRLREEIAAKTGEQMTGLKDGYSCDCWYGIKEITVSGRNGSFPADAYYTGGDYFNIHKPEIISGSVYHEDTANIDTVVLDANMSWKLFGSLETAGMTVNIGNNDFYISAVIQTPGRKTKNLEKAYENSGSANIYLPYQAANALLGEEQKFTAYEALLPDQINGFAESIVTEALSSAGSISGVTEDAIKKYSANGLIFCNNGNPSLLLVDSRTDEFHIDRIREYSKIMFTDSGVGFDLPFYEEAAGSVLMKLGSLYKTFFPVFVILMVSACYWIVQFCRLIAICAKRIYKYFDDKADRKKLENYYKTHPKIIIKEIDEGESK